MIVLGRYNYLTWKCIAMQQWIARLDTSLSSSEQTRDALARGQGTFMRCKDLKAIGAGADQHDRGGAGRQGAGRQADRLGKPQDRHGLPDALIQKIVVFEFVNNYFSLLYIAFFSTSRCRTTGSSTAGTRCPSRTAPGRSCRAG